MNYTRHSMMTLLYCLAVYVPLGVLIGLFEWSNDGPLRGLIAGSAAALSGVFAEAMDPKTERWWRWIIAAAAVLSGFEALYYYAGFGVAIAAAVILIAAVPFTVFVIRRGDRMNAMNQALATLLLVAFSLVAIPAHAQLASDGQTNPLAGKLTVKFGTAADHVQVDNTGSFSDEEETRTQTASHNVTFRNVTVEYQINNKWIVAGRYETGAIRDASDFNRDQQYHGRDRDMGVRIERFVADQAWVHMGYAKLEASLDVSETILQYGPPPVIIVVGPGFSGAVPIGPAPIIGTNTMRLVQDDSYQAIEFGFGGRASYKRAFYELSMEGYPLAINNTEVKTSYNHEKLHGGSNGGPAYGFRIGGSLGYLLYKGVGVEGNFRLVSLYGPNDDDFKNSYHRGKVGIALVLKF